MFGGANIPGDQFESSHLFGQPERFHQEDEWMQRTWDHAERIIAQRKPKSREFGCEGNRFHECVWINAIRTDYIDDASTKFTEVDVEDRREYVPRSNVNN
jgi:hypothetical protein